MIKIYGHSDDVIEIESDDTTQFPNEEFSAADHNLIAVSDGTLFDIYFNRYGTWTIDVVYRGSQFLGVEIWKGNDGTDFLMLDEYPKWIVLRDDVIHP